MIPEHFDSKLPSGLSLRVEDSVERRFGIQISLRPTAAYFMGPLGWLFKKVRDFFLPKTTPYEDSITVTTDGDTTTIRPSLDHELGAEWREKT
jgi:hypothetical protein